MQEEVAMEMIKKISKSQADTFQKIFKYFDVRSILLYHYVHWKPDSRNHVYDASFEDDIHEHDII